MFSMTESRELDEVWGKTQTKTASHYGEDVKFYPSYLYPYHPSSSYTGLPKKSSILEFAVYYRKFSTTPAGGISNARDSGLNTATFFLSSGN